MTRPIIARKLMYAVALATVFSLFVLHHAVFAETLETLPWEQTKTLLNRASSVWTAPPRNVVRATMTRGPLLGNGGVGVTATSDTRSVGFLISHNGFICDAFRPSPARIGGVTITSTSSSADRKPPANFVLEQRLAAAELRAALDGGWTVRSFVAATRDALVAEVANPTDKPLSLRIATWTPLADDTFPSAAGVRGDLTWATRETYSGMFTLEQTDGKPRPNIQARWVSRAALATRVFGAKCKTELDPETNTADLLVTLAPGQGCVVVTQIGMHRGESPLEATLAAVLADTPESITDLNTAHAMWWQDYWAKSQVVLNDAVLERYYYTALYALACSNRAGKDAPGLYGSWITEDAPLWGSDIHLNYNGQAPYFGVYSANRAELAAPFNAAIIAMIPEGRRRAKEDGQYINRSLQGKSFEGILFPVGICSSLGVACCDRYLNQVYDASYSAMQFIEQYEFTHDDQFLKQDAYPFVLACGDFWESYLDVTEVNGRKQYTFAGGTREGMWGRLPSADLAFVKRIFLFLETASRILGKDESRRAKWRDILEHLPPLPTITKGGKTVIAWDANGRFRTDENCLGIDCIYPGNAINLASSDGALLKIAQDTVGSYNAWGHLNNMPRIFLSHLRVGTASDATRNAFMAVLKSTGENGMVVDKFHGLEKCGGIEVVNRLLLSSDDEVLRLFIAWDWKQDAAFYNLRAKGAFLVSAELKNGMVAGVKLVSEKGHDCTGVNPWPSKSFQLIRNDKQAETISGERFTFRTVAGERIEFRPQ